MGDRPSKDALHDGLASVANALGSGRRAGLVDALAQGERRVDDLAAEIGLSIANTSQHLQTLRRAGLLRTRRERTRVHYALASEHVTQMWTVTGDVATAHAANVDQLAEAYLGDGSDLEVMSRDQLLDRLGADDVVVLDVRPQAEFAAGYVAGAINFPAEGLAEHPRQLPDGKRIFAYCRRPLYVLSVDAVRPTRSAGRSAALLEDGYPEWASAGLPVERIRA
jgi:rhodanese-related sulfurtransferase